MSQATVAAAVQERAVDVCDVSLDSAVRGNSGNVALDGIESLSANACEIDKLSPDRVLRLLAKQSSILGEEGVARALTWLILNPLEVQVGWMRYSAALRALMDRLFDLASATTSCAPTFLVPFASDAVECMESGRPIAAAALAGATTAMACVAHGAAAPALMCCVAEVLMAVSKRTHELTAEELVAAATAGAAVDCTTGTGCPQLVGPIRELARAAAERARELRGSVLSDAAWTLARLETAGMVPPAAFTTLIADRLDAASVLDLEAHEITRLAMVLADSNVKSSSAANALAVAVRTHAEMTDGEVEWSSLEFLSLAQALGRLATAAGRRDVGFHLGLAVRRCSHCLQTVHVLGFVAVLASLHLPLDTKAAQALATQLFKGIDNREPVTGAWAATLEVLEPHASCLMQWQALVTKVEEELHVPVVKTLLSLLGNSRGPALSVDDARQALQRLSLGDVGTAFTSRILFELEVLASNDESWVKSFRDKQNPAEVKENLNTCSVAAMSFEFAGFVAAGLGGSEEAFSVPATQKLQIRHLKNNEDENRSNDVLLPFLQIDVRARGACATVSALFQAAAALFAAAAGDAAAGEWRLISGEHLTMQAGNADTRESDSGDDEVFLLLAPNGFPCAMRELRVFRPHRALGHIRIFCQGRPSSPEAWLLLAQLKRLLPRVVISIALEAPNRKIQSSGVVRGTTPNQSARSSMTSPPLEQGVGLGTTPGQSGRSSMISPPPKGYQKQCHSTTPPTVESATSDIFGRVVTSKPVVPRRTTTQQKRDWQNCKQQAAHITAGVIALQAN